MLRHLGGVSLVIVCALSACCTRRHSNSPQPSVGIPSQFSRSERTPTTSPALLSFFDDVKESYSASELRETADHFLEAHPDIEGFVPTNLWPATLKAPKGKLNQPTFIFVSRLSNGKQGMMIEFAGSPWMRGIYVLSQSKPELQRDPRGRVEYLKWDEGVYVYFTQ